ncbi:hypothetical protein F0726_00405 [Acidithiobacillus caldus]|nr:hypothetical protein F0726_00405 [Acidithiobacillus caldus]
MVPPLLQNAGGREREKRKEDRTTLAKPERQVAR